MKNVRRLALDTLDRIFGGKSYSNIAVDTVIRRENLSGKDRSFFCALVYGVVEKKITLDYFIDAISTLPASSVEPQVQNILRLGLYQLRFLDRVPTHAAVSETVALAPARSRGFVNAILRTYSRREDSLLLQDRKDSLRYLSVTYSCCEPLCQKLAEEFGSQKAESILAAWESVPPVTLRVNSLKTTREKLLATLIAKGMDASVTENSPHGIRIPNAVLADTGLEEGLCFVQDEASQIAVEALDAQPGDTVYDICACPGSKSFGAALDMENKGKLLSFDIHENKLSLVRTSAERLGITILETRTRDGRIPDETLFETADRVICDVPCSGFGVIAKKPELRYKNPTDCNALPMIQADILANACRYVKPGGRLVYSTCTIFSDENAENIDRFLASHPDFVPRPFSVGKLNAPNGRLTLLPDTHGTDGFFIAVLERKDTGNV